MRKDGTLNRAHMLRLQALVRDFQSWPKERQSRYVFRQHFRAITYAYDELCALQTRAKIAALGLGKSR